MKAQQRDYLFQQIESIYTSKTKELQRPSGNYVDIMEHVRNGGTATLKPIAQIQEQLVSMAAHGARSGWNGTPNHQHAIMLEHVFEIPADILNAQREYDANAAAYKARLKLLRDRCDGLKEAAILGEAGEFITKLNELRAFSASL